MDRKQMIVERTRAVFADRIEDMVHVVREDRQNLRGWEEPAHLRAAVRRTIREGANSETETTDVPLAEPEFGRTAGEPDRGQQREGIGQLLEAGANGLERVSRELCERVLRAAMPR